MDERRPGRYPAAHGLPHVRRGRLPVAADDRDGVLVDVDGNTVSELLAGQAALAGPPEALGEVGVVDVGLVDPDGVARHDPVLVDGRRCERAVPPLEGGLVGDAAQLRRALDGDVVAHVTDEGDPDGERLPAVLEDGAREGGEPPAAAAVAPPRDAGGGGVPATTGGSTGRPRSSARPACSSSTSSGFSRSTRTGRGCSSRSSPMHTRGSRWQSPRTWSSAGGDRCSGTTRWPPP